jgi:hypothetical protein
LSGSDSTDSPNQTRDVKHFFFFLLCFSFSPATGTMDPLLFLAKEKRRMNWLPTEVVVVLILSLRKMATPPDALITFSPSK